uniref:Acyltransferase 3 domain-containing protein n=1 Tax=Euplotes crassus TaxID=5936 RepID=A0A7S3NV25_EUPCR|mmetsp:Transcript_22898/g.22744  ORF Transcript_22898/g.22744 Transcript_22898/m.22744 type:complete len:324 (+) Transcript_22898:1122-2093(+)
MMFFIILPIVVFAYCRHKLIGYILTSGLIMMNIIIVFIISTVHHHPMTIMKDGNPSEIYHKPHARFGAYFVGCLFGIMYYEWKKSKTAPEYERTIGAIFFRFVESSNIIRYLFHLIGTIIILFLVMITFTETSKPNEIVWPQIPASFFNALHRPLFVTGLALFLAGPMIGKSRFLRFILGGSAWAPWAKITFMVYLIHLILIIWFYAQIRQALYMTTRVAVYYWFAAFILSYLIAIPITLLIESPILQLSKHLFLQNAPLCNFNDIKRLNSTNHQLEKLLLFAPSQKTTNLQKLEAELDAKMRLLDPASSPERNSMINETNAD